MYRIKHFFTKILKLISFLPVLWKDEDWDYEYLLILLRTKLIWMKKYFTNSHIIVDEERLKIIQEVENTIEEINSFLNFELSDNHEIDPPFEISHTTVPVENGAGCKIIDINKETGKELTKEEEEAYTKYLRALYDKENEHWNNIFNIIKEHGQGWWD